MSNISQHQILGRGIRLGISSRGIISDDFIIFNYKKSGRTYYKKFDSLDDIEHYINSNNHLYGSICCTTLYEDIKTFDNRKQFYIYYNAFKNRLITKKFLYG